MSRFFLSTPILYFVLFAGGNAEPVSYNRDVRPILSNNCFLCHGFDQEKREGDLRLDTYEGAIATSTSGGSAAIVPGHPEKSELIDRILTDDTKRQMPPNGSVYKLTDKEKKILEQWIKEGAVYEDHWAYKELARPALPEPAKHPVDSFIQRGYKEHAVVAVEKADPRTLLRRLSYDLRGLPPTSQEVEAFAKDPSSAHYERFVDRWLSSLESAEHQALLWLDLVRWADSSGMVSDEPIASGPYRKYVVEAFRNNMPFDQFTREQLAGDLLPERNDRTLTASAYNRLVKTNSEAGVIEKEALYALKGEHVRALGTVWLGATTGCAECHDHKYDPITAKDYYSMAAFFDDLIEVGVYDPGDRRVPLHYIHDKPSDTASDNELTKQITDLREAIYGSSVDLKKLTEWEKQTLAASREASKKKGDVDWVWMPAQLPPAHITRGDFEPTPAGRRVVAKRAVLTRHLSGETMRSRVHGKNNGFFVELEIDPQSPPELIAMQTINGAYGRLGWHRDYHVTYYWGPKDHSLLKKDRSWISPKNLVHMGPLPEVGKKVRLEIPKKKIRRVKFDTVALSWIQAGGTVTWKDSGYKTDSSRHFTNTLAASTIRYWWELPFNRDDRKDMADLVLKSLRIKPEKRRPIHNKVLTVAFQEAQHPELVARLEKIYREVLLLRQDSLPTLVSKVGPAKRTHLLNRGNFMEEQGEPLTPAIPEAFGKTDSSRRATRLDLANWLVSPENSITPRVFVNRLWHQFYGRGLSETLEDSGNQGDWPSHIDLLDWLAFEFRGSGWNVRQMMRLLVLSETYQLSSIPTADLVEKDPTNRWHARQSRHRHSAEEIRDAALNAAGILSLTEEIPTQSFYPYQPDSYWVKSNKIMYGSRYQIWETSAGTSQYQRSLYTFWKRQNIHPSLLALDAPTRQECVARRTITNTPAQALALLNDPSFVEAARVLAQRILIDHREGSAVERIQGLFDYALQRKASPEELAEVEKLVGQMQNQFSSDPDRAKSLVKVGQHPLLDELDPVEHATWTATARLILNLHEFITRS